MPTTYGNDIVYCLKSHCGVRGYCRQKWVLQVQIICKFSNERTCKRNKDVQGLSCGFEDYRYNYKINKTALTHNKINAEKTSQHLFILLVVPDRTIYTDIVTIVIAFEFEIIVFEFIFILFHS